MPCFRRASRLLPPALAFALLIQAPGPAPALADGAAEVRLYRLVTMRGDVLLGITTRDLAALGQGPDVEAIARRIAEDGQFTAWRYSAVRGADGAPRFVTRDRVAVLQQDALLVEPYQPGLPVLPPPAR